MTHLLPIIAIVFAAFCIWLTVRIVNRRERWAKRTLAAVVGLPLTYVLSFGPACWMADRDVVSRSRAAAIYSLILADLPADDVLWSYGNLGCRDPFTMLHLLILANVKPTSGELIDGSGG